MIDVYEDRKVATLDLPGAFLQTEHPKDKFTLLLQEGKFVGIVFDINPKYKQHVRFKYSRKIFYLRIIKAINGLFESSLLWYELYLGVFNQFSSYERRTDSGTPVLGKKGDAF